MGEAGDGLAVVHQVELSHPDLVVMVGDDLDNDVLAAQVVGMRGMLVRTGKFRQERLDRHARDQYAMQPAFVVDSVADLPAVLEIGR